MNDVSTMSPFRPAMPAYVPGGITEIPNQGTPIAPPSDSTDVRHGSIILEPEVVQKFNAGTIAPQTLTSAIKMASALASYAPGSVAIQEVDGVLQPQIRMDPNIQICPEPVDTGAPIPEPFIQVCPEPWLTGNDGPLDAAPTTSVAAAQPATAIEKQAVVSGNNAFTVDLFNKVVSEEAGKNTFISPFSVSTVMNTLRAGARGETAQELAQTLHLELPENRVHQAFGGVIDSVSKNANVTGEDGQKAVDLRISNRVFTHNGYPVEADFQRVTRDDYKSEAASVDFVGQPEAARETINGQVEKDTDGKIKNLFPEGSITSDTRLAVTNAITFKGNWKSKFNEEMTDPEGTFHPTASTEVTTPMMRQNAEFGYFGTNLDGTRPAWNQTPQLQVLELPFQGENVVLDVILPQDMKQLEAAMTPQKLEEWLSSTYSQDVNVTMPKFTMASEYDLTGTLQEMGIHKAFGGGDFSGINKSDDLCVSVVVHKARFACDEKGAEFQAATGAAVSLECAAMPATFTADKPFLFAVRDKESGSILAMGRVNDPTAG